MTARPYQSKLKGDVYTAWNQGARNVLMRLDTGGGKTFILADILREHQGAAAVIAHRHELVGQLSQALARQNIQHNLIASQSTRRAAAQAHMIEFGVSYYNPGARVAVCSIDTLVRADGIEAWAAQVTLWVTDEGHHVVLDNKWHRGIQLFGNPHVRGLLPTATPGRADGKGLGRDYDGVADVMVEGPPMRWLIDSGYLSDYEIVCPASDLQVLEEAGASGDWSSKQLREAAKRSHIVGDVVRAYCQWARGKLGITFSTDIETATEMANAYNLAGVRAAVLTGKTDDGLRRQILRQFEARQLDQIVAVDIISEGFDVPAVEVLSMARPTQSLPLYMQQFGRALRIMDGKGKALIIDHASNTVRHQGPPDKPRPWTLARREGGRSKSAALDLYRVCLGCSRPFERFYTECPYCGQPIPEPGVRSSPAMVDGDLVMLDPATLAQLRGEIDALDAPADYYARDLAGRGMPPIGVQANYKRRLEQQEAQGRLRAAMDLWAGRRHAAGRTDRQIQREFYLTFGVDGLTARTWKPDDAAQLQARIEGTP